MNHTQNSIMNMANYICDYICQKPKEITDQEQLEDYCSGECQIGTYINQILNQYNEIFGILERYRNIVLCKECKYSGVTKVGKMYCTHKTEVFDYYKSDKDGCSKGERKDERLRKRNCK